MIYYYVNIYCIRFELQIIHIIFVSISYIHFIQYLLYPMILKCKYIENKYIIYYINTRI